MKKVLLLAGVLVLGSTSGCLIAEGGGHGRHGGHTEVIVPAPLVIVPVVRVHHD